MRDSTVLRPLLVFTLSVIVGLGVMASCKGPAGTEGPQGPEGPVGPAGKDGSMMYSGQGAPGSNIGSDGDYYLNTNTGELHGPKDADGWGNPIMVLMGQDGDDGEDGSQIHAGSGTPAASQGKVGDYYLDKSSYDLYGPKTSSGWGSPINLKGAEGNANVTRYILPGHDFSKSFSVNKKVPSLEDKAEMKNSAWLVYMIKPYTYSKNVDDQYWQIPGYVFHPNNSKSYVYYTLDFYWDDGDVVFFIATKDAAPVGKEFDRIEILQIESSNTIDQRKSKQAKLIPDSLDISDYSAVAEYYGLGVSNDD